MTLIQILLPTCTKNGKTLPHKVYTSIQKEIVARFGGLTAFTQSPAEGFWINTEERTERDAMIMVEVMVDVVDKEWWQAFRDRLETQLEQESIVIRAIEMERI